MGHALLETDPCPAWIVDLGAQVLLFFDKLGAVGQVDVIRRLSSRGFRHIPHQA